MRESFKISRHGLVRIELVDATLIEFLITSYNVWGLVESEGRYFDEIFTRVAKGTLSC